MMDKSQVIFENDTSPPEPNLSQGELKQIRYYLQKLSFLEQQKLSDLEKEELLVGIKYGRSLMKSMTSPPELPLTPLDFAPNLPTLNNIPFSTTSPQLDNLLKRPNRTLLTVSSISPLSLFPNSICVEESRITVTFRQFFSTSQVHSVDIPDISNVFIEFAPLSASLIIVSRTFVENQIQIGNLRKKEAIKTRRVIEGLRISVREKVDTSEYHVEELIVKLEGIGASRLSS